MTPSDEVGRPLILVVDDEPFILQYIKHVLQLTNYDVLTTTSVDEAWAVFEQRQLEIELVLTDIVMPGSVDGLELAARIHRLNPDLPVLFITGAFSEVDPRTAKMDEEHLLLRKPFFPKQLVEFVDVQMCRESSGIGRGAALQTGHT